MEVTEGEIIVLKNPYPLSRQMANIIVQKTDLVDKLNSELTKHKLMIGEIIEAGKEEFLCVQATMKILYEESARTVVGIKDPGTKEFLKEKEAETDVVDEAWLLDRQDQHTAKITSDELQV